MFDNLEKLFDFVLRHNQTLVFGNLGRLPHIFVDFLTTHYPLHKILIVSKYYTITVPSDNFRQVEWSNAWREKCDLLILIEPFPYSDILENYPNASRTLILTSHLVLKLKNIDCAVTYYFHKLENYNASKIRELINLQEGSEENHNIQMIKNHINHPSVVTIGPCTNNDVAIIPGKSSQTALSKSRNFVIVNLSTVRQPIEIFLRFWDAFDYMLYNMDKIDRWSILFGERMRNVYESFCQECINKLFCQTQFENHLKDILPLLPFYKSGTIDKSFHIEKSKFCELEYVSPNTLLDAFKATFVYDLKPLVGSVYQLT